MNKNTNSHSGSNEVNSTNIFNPHNSHNINNSNNRNIILEDNNCTVVAEYTPLVNNSSMYQSEDQLEKEFISQLQSQGYEYVTITSSQELVDNLRAQLYRLNKENLNNREFSDREWNKFFTDKIANPNKSVVDKTAQLQQTNTAYELIRDDGSTVNIHLINKVNIHANYLQVIKQYATTGGSRSNRYDVTILINGLPIVHTELKRRGVHIKEAFNQINRYARDSFWADNGLFEYMQIFVISNGTETKYYSNSTRYKENNSGISSNSSSVGSSKKPSKQTSSSYEFTCWWADGNNKPITDLIDFTKTFFGKNTLLNILTKFCIFTTDKQLLVMRPYQIIATEKILNRIDISTNAKTYGTVKAGGYIWHTTGSGKTLTSFKTAQLVSQLPKEQVAQVLFIVDRKDLDYQTMKEFNKFQEGAVNANETTQTLIKNLVDPDVRIIVTTIQKLSRFINSSANNKIFNEPTVLIFDECHRSQFGDMHASIVKSFKKYYLFGFTGTPILAENHSKSNLGNYRTTEQAFGTRLHDYTIVNAIRDENVLKFRVDYLKTFHPKDDIEDKKSPSINKTKVLQDPKRITKIVEYIREHFDQKTKRASSYNLQIENKEKRLDGFNSIFAVSSIEDVKRYYLEFKEQQKDLPADQQLKVATIYSYAPNDDVEDGKVGSSADFLVDENLENTSGLNSSDRDFLDSVILDYNQQFGCSYNTDSGFQDYYKDVSNRVKNKEIDILLVVNMFLTGFDSKTLNTLWVDKNLQYHGLLQAFSRTNRILNSVKTFGNIVCFRNLEQATNDAIRLFSNREAEGIVLMKTYDEYYNGYEDDNGNQVTGYKVYAERMLEQFPPGVIIESEHQKKEFIALHNNILKLKNILTSFDDFTELKDQPILTPRQFQDYQGTYNTYYDQFRKNNNSDQEDINDDIVFEIELTKQTEYNIDYILKLIAENKGKLSEEKLQKEINSAIDSSMQLRNKKDLIISFSNQLNPQSDVHDDWNKFIDVAKVEELNKIIEDENLDKEKTYKYIKQSFEDNVINSSGTTFNQLIPSVSRFTKDNQKEIKRLKVLQKLQEYFDRFRDIVNF